MHYLRPIFVLLRSLRLSFVLFAVPCLLVLILLGNWQMERLAWKTAYIARIETRLAAPVIPLPPAAQWPTMTQDSYEFRRVRLVGQFIHSKAQYWYARSQQGQAGVHVITPLLLPDGAMVLVNRGFVPQARRDPKTRAGGQVAGQVAFSGLLHWPSKRGRFTPPDEPADNFWFTRDLAGMAQNIGIRAAPFFVDADSPPPIFDKTANPLATGALDDWPLGGQTRIHLPNRHLGYALTWYGLAIGLVIIFVLWHLQRAEKNRFQT